MTDRRKARKPNIPVVRTRTPMMTAILRVSGPRDLKQDARVLTNEQAVVIDEHGILDGLQVEGEQYHDV